jgi:chorismate synthase
MSSFGTVIHIDLFGESHGPKIGIVIHNLPAGLRLDQERIQAALSRRRPSSDLATARQESDPYEIVSGYFNDHTTGTPLTILIPNQDTRSRDYEPDILRPSHSDYVAHIKYHGHHDYRGGGHFSGRITAPLVILGAICEQILEQKGVHLASHIRSIHHIEDDAFTLDNLTKETLKRLYSSHFPLLDESVNPDMEAAIRAAKSDNDSVGGIVETAVIGVPAGYGDPFFDKVESLLSHLIFSIPAVKGLSFGDGFDMTRKRGSETNDAFFVENGVIKTSTNHSGGIQGGITNGMPIVFQTAIKPTSSIGLPQHTVNIKTMQEETLELVGRHDPAIVHRAVHVINAITSYAILELMARREGPEWIR